MPNPSHPPHLVDVRALTLHNPWAWAIAHAEKDVENRGWMPPTTVDQILIHAGKAWDNRAGTFLRSWGITPPPGPGDVSAIVAVADIAWACDAFVRGHDCNCGRWAIAGQCHWKLGNVWTLNEPVPCKGRQRLWIPSPEVVDSVRADLAQVMA